MIWNRILILLAISAWLAPAHAGMPGIPTKDPCIHYLSDIYYNVPSQPLRFPNFTAQRFSYYYVCPAKVNFTICYQTPTSYPNGNLFECQSNLMFDKNGNYDPSKTTPLKKDDPMISAAIIVSPKATKKYYKICSSGDAVCLKALLKLNKCMWQNEACVTNAGGSQILP